MRPVGIDIERLATDPGWWGHSFANLAELFVPCLDAAGARSVVEIGAYAGDLTGVLLEWASRGQARIVAVDPRPQPELVDLAAERQDLELVRETSLDALEHLELPDAVIVDGDHNHWTVSREVEAILRRAGRRPPPLMLFHDVGWPHGRRDAYYAPHEVPDEHRQPLREGGGLFPGDRGTRDGALPYKWPAAREGGPRNGVLTAIEDATAGRDDLRLAVVPGFFGFGAVWPVGAPWAAAVAEVLDPWDRNPVLERLEANRVHHLAMKHVVQMEVEDQRRRLSRKDDVLRTLVGSRSLTLAQRIMKLTGRATPAFSRDGLRRALSDGE